MKIIDRNLVASIQYQDDPDNYDVRLHRLGRYNDEFIIINPDIDPKTVECIDFNIQSKSLLVWIKNDIWVAKKFHRNWHPQLGWKVFNLIFGDIIKNPKLSATFPEIEFDISLENYVVERHYEHVWYLDPKFSPKKEKIWVYKYQAHNNILGTKDMGFIEPYINKTLEVNPVLPSIFKVPELDTSDIFNFGYEHIWYYLNKSNKIWVYKQKLIDNVKGIKDMGLILPEIPSLPDVFFLSFNEPNADENWARLQSLVPHAKRIHGINGILNAHIEAANQSLTDIFYVVDADAWVLEDFDFKFQPDIIDRMATHIWFSWNPITDDSYGNGGIKLMYKDNILKYQHSGQLDFATSFSSKIKVISKVGNINKFASDDYHAYKGAFRETVKLLNQQYDQDSVLRLNKWKNIKIIDSLSKFAALGVQDAERYFNGNSELININDPVWLKNYFLEHHA